MLRTIAFAQLRAEDTRNHAPEPQRSLQSSEKWLLKDSGKLDLEDYLDLVAADADTEAGP